MVHHIQSSVLMSLEFIGTVEFAITNAVIYSTRWNKNISTSSCFMSDLFRTIKLAVGTSVCEGFVASIWTITEVVVQFLPRKLF